MCFQTLTEHLQDVHSLNIDIQELKKSLIILDGLDELQMKNKLQASDIDEIFRIINLEIEQHPALRVIITSRFGYLNLEKIIANEIFVFQLQELDLAKQYRWLKSYRQYHPETWLNEKELARIDKQDKSYLKELVRQPILLHMIAGLGRELSQDVNRAKVYESLFDQITDPNIWKKNQIYPLKGLESSDLRTALQEMAYEIWRSGDGYIHKSKVETLNSIQDIRNKLPATTEFQKVLKLLMVAFYFQEVAKDGPIVPEEDTYNYAIEFLHKSLQEYLTAEYIWYEIFGTIQGKSNATRQDRI